jgi:hypothetical protein
MIYEKGENETVKEGGKGVHTCDALSSCFRTTLIATNWAVSLYCAL